MCFVAADLGTESVSGTLSSLQQCNPHDGFDMFAQTRGNSLAEQRKTYVGTISVALRRYWGRMDPGLVTGQHKEAFYLPAPGLPRTLKYGCEDLAVGTDIK